MSSWSTEHQWKAQVQSRMLGLQNTVVAQCGAVDRPQEPYSPVLPHAVYLLYSDQEFSQLFVSIHFFLPCPLDLAIQC